MKSFTRNSILITGCSSGIGLCVARDMHDLGWDVVAACRKKKDSIFIQENYGIKIAITLFLFHILFLDNINYAIKFN